MDDHYFSEVDTEAKGYLLGWIASDGHISPEGAIIISIHEDDEEIIRNLRDSICSELPFWEKYTSTTNMIGFSFCSKTIMQDLCTLLRISPGKKSDTVRFPQGLSEEISWAFLRGLFDGDGTLRSLREKRAPHRHCAISSTSMDMKRDIGRFVGDLNYHIRDDSISFTGESCVTFLNKIYANASPHLRLRRKYELYLDYVVYAPGLRGQHGKLDNCKYAKTRLDAIDPTKKNDTDDGYCITLLEPINVINETLFVMKLALRYKPMRAGIPNFL